MELSSIQHIAPEKLLDFQPDLFIACLSYESRSTSIARQLETFSCRKVALCSQNQVKEYAYSDNLQYFQDQGFEILYFAKEDAVCKDIFAENGSGKMKIIMDCTSMSQILYYQILNWFSEDHYPTSASLRMVYTMAAYVDEGSPPRVKKVREFLKVKKKPRQRKQVLLLGLGQEPGVSETICRLVKPDLLYLFYADPPAEKEFVEKVFVNNHAVINETAIRNLVSYPINNGQIIYQELIDIILPLRKEYDVSIIPQGPKIFSMASMLLQIGYPDTLLSYPVFKRNQVKDRMPCGKPVILDIHFEAED